MAKEDASSGTAPTQPSSPTADDKTQRPPTPQAKTSEEPTIRVFPKTRQELEAKEREKEARRKARPKVSSDGKKILAYGSQGFGHKSTQRSSYRAKSKNLYAMGGYRNRSPYGNKVRNPYKAGGSRNPYGPRKAYGSKSSYRTASSRDRSTGRMTPSSAGKTSTTATFLSDSSDENGVTSDADIVPAEERLTKLRGCGLFFFTAGAYNKFRPPLFSPFHPEPLRYDRPRWAHEPEHAMALASAVVSIYHLSTFANSVSVNGGAAFILAYIIIDLLVGFPILTLEVLLGQFSGRNTVEIFRRLCPIATGLGWASIFVGTVKLTFLVPTIGMSFFGLIVALFDQRTCSSITPEAYRQEGGDPATLKYCYDARKRLTCERGLNESQTSFYYKGKCYRQTQEDWLKFLGLLSTCLEDPEANYAKNPQNRKPARMELRDMFQATHACGFTLVFTLPNLKRTRWFSHYHESGGFLVAKESWWARQTAFWRLLEDAEEGAVEEVELRLLQHMIRTRLASPFATATNLGRFLEAHKLAFPDLVADYCATLGPNLTWGCLRDILISRESLPNNDLMQVVAAADTERFTQNSMAVVGILLTWIMVLVPTFQGVRWLSKTLFFTNYYPTVAVIAMIYYGVFVEGFSEGVRVRMTPDWARLLDANTWLTALWQNLINIPIGTGAIPVIGSFGTFHQDAFGFPPSPYCPSQTFPPEAHVGVVALWSLGMACGGTVFGFGMMGVVGHAMERKQEELGPSVDEIYYAIVNVDQNHFHYTALLLTFTSAVVWMTLGLSSALAIYEGVICCITENMRYFTHRRPAGRLLIGSVLTLICFIVGLPSSDNHASDITEILLTVVFFLAMSNIVLTIFIVMYVYGVRRWSQDLEIMLDPGVQGPSCSTWVWGSRLRHYFQAAWVSLPVFLAALAVWNAVLTDKDSELDAKNRALEKGAVERKTRTDEVTELFYWFFPVLFSAAYVLILLGPGAWHVLRKWRKGRVKTAFRVARAWRPADLRTFARHHLVYQPCLTPSSAPARDCTDGSRSRISAYYLSAETLTENRSSDHLPPP